MSLPSSLSTLAFFGIGLTGKPMATCLFHGQLMPERNARRSGQKPDQGFGKCTDCSFNGRSPIAGNEVGDAKFWQYSGKCAACRSIGCFACTGSCSGKRLGVDIDKLPEEAMP
ncbi:MAG TPA: hypothetical protein VGO51_04550 [Burkholderiaceae bacterium]|nr:hypothetical protein [Burkholderiaceae bacterium]